MKSPLKKSLMNGVMAGIVYGLSSGLVVSSASVPVVPISRNAVNLFGPGHSTGTGISTSTGATVSTTATFVNRSGAPITIGSLAFAGWLLTTSGTSNVGNDVPVTANIEYPLATTFNSMLQSGGTTITIPNGSQLKTDDVTLTTPIPDGATFKVNISATQANGQKYLGTVNGTTGHAFGLCGVLTTALASTLKKEMIYAVGDSISTNNSGVWHVAAQTAGCPSLQMSISGTLATTYGSSSAANFVKQANMAALIGATAFCSNFGTNDFGSSRSLAQLQTDLMALKAKAASVGVKWYHATMTPRTSITTITASAVVSSGTAMTVSVADASKFEAGNCYVIAGATQTEYNGSRKCTAIDTGLNTVTLFFPGSATPTATGTITIVPRTWGSIGLQIPSGGSAFAFNNTCDRALYNAWVRAGAFDSFIEWADACEPSRDAGRWAVGGEKPELIAPFDTTTKTGFTANNRFQLNGTITSNIAPNGLGQFTTGANIGEVKGGNGNTGGDWTASSAYTNVPTVGDGFYVYPGVHSPSDDGLHPRVAVGTIGTAGYVGGQALIQKPTNSWLAARLV